MPLLLSPPQLLPRSPDGQPVKLGEAMSQSVRHMVSRSVQCTYRSAGDRSRSRWASHRRTRRERGIQGRAATERTLNGRQPRSAVGLPRPRRRSAAHPSLLLLRLHLLNELSLLLADSLQLRLSLRPLLSCSGFLLSLREVDVIHLRVNDTVIRQPAVHYTSEVVCTAPLLLSYIHGCP